MNYAAAWNEGEDRKDDELVVIGITVVNNFDGGW